MNSKKAKEKERKEGEKRGKNMHSIKHKHTIYIISLVRYLGWVFETQEIGCNNGIGGWHENIVTFKHPKLPDFL